MEALDLLGPIRRALLVTLKTLGRGTAEDVGRENYLSAGAARQHLLALASEGLVTHEIERKGPGRPRHYYQLTAKGHSLFPQGYARLAESLLESLEYAPPEVQRRVLSQMRQQFWGEGLGTNEGPIPLSVATEFLESKGYMPTVTETSPGVVELAMGHCPLLQLAEKFPLLCTCEKEGLREGLGASAVETPQHRLEGDSVCVFRLYFDQTDRPPDEAESPCSSPAEAEGVEGGSRGSATDAT